MGSEWPETLLEEIADEVTVGFVGSMTSEYVEDGIPFFRSKNVSPYRISWDDVKYVSREFHQNEVR
jgi:type I restriction enzyme S subunit